MSHGRSRERPWKQQPACIEHVRRFAEAAIVSDGDVVFQPLKIQRSGLMDSFDSRVLIYIHKEQELDDVAQHYPADHYVFVDDKVRILAAVKELLRGRREGEKLN